MADEAKRFYGVQFHPEVTHTRQGARMLEHFVKDICGCECLWTPATIIDDAVARIREQVGDDEVILGLSGGVDSSVVAMLVHRAIGDRLTCVFVDNGLLRLNEGQQVMDMFGDHFGLNIIKVDAEERFLSALAGSTSRKPSARPSAASSSKCSTTSPRSSRTPSGWPRAPSTRTSSNPLPARPARPTSSSPTTTSAACRKR